MLAGLLGGGFSKLPVLKDTLRLPRRTLDMVCASNSYEGSLLTKPTGSIARIMPNTVVTDDAELYRKMNAMKGSSYTKGAWYAGFKLDAERENLFTERNEERHARVRQQLAPGVSPYRSVTVSVPTKT